MSSMPRLFSLLVSFIFAIQFTLAAAAPPGGSPGHGNGGGSNEGKGGMTATLSSVKPKDWGESHVRRVLSAFAYGGLATDAQIETWAGTKPADAVSEILTFGPANTKLSPPDGWDDSDLHCHSLESLQAFWSSDDPGNAMRYDDRFRYATLSTNVPPRLNTTNLQRTRSKVISTRGCNPFLHKMGLFLTNYLASDRLPAVGTAAADQLVFCTTTDFGRQLRVNGDRGTVHGRGAIPP